MSEGTVEDPVLGHRLSFERITDEKGGQALRVEIWVDRSGGVPPHVHPGMEERFEVLAGTAEFLGGRKWQSAGPGQIVVVSPGTRHAYRNRGDQVAHVLCTATPPSSLQAFLEETAALNQAGRLTKHAIPKSPRALLEGVALAHRHRQMVELGFPPMPPPTVRRLLFPPLVRFARRRGYAVAQPPQTRA